MAMVVKNNMSAINTLNTLNKNTSALQKSLQKVSSGMKINSAQDDASGYAISERMRVMISSLDQANQNTQNGSSLMKVAEGAVSNTVEILKTLKQKAIDAATDTNTDDDRATIQKEIDQFVDQIDDNALVTFNGKYLLDGSKTPSGKATYGSMTNEALSTETSALTKLTDLYARNGEHLIIESTDKVTASYVQGGRTYVTTFQVGDNTLGDVFRNVESIDQTSKIFATSENEDVAAAGGLITQGATKDAVDAAVKYLKDALSTKDTNINASADGVLHGDQFIKSTADSDNKLKLAPTQTAGEVDKFFTVNEVGAITIKIDSATGMSGSYNGEIFQKVKDALQNYNTIVTQIGSVTVLGGAKTAGSGMASNLWDGLHDLLDETWDGDLGNIYQYKDKIYASGNETLISYYESYTEATAQKDSAFTALQSAITDYNKGLAQLDVLTKLQNFEQGKLSYQAAVDSWISALRTEMLGATDGVYKLGAGATTSNLKDISFDAGDGNLSDADRASTINTITTAVRDEMYKALEDASLDLVDLAGDDGAGDGTLTDGSKPLSNAINAMFKKFTFTAGSGGGTSKYVSDGTALIGTFNTSLGKAIADSIKADLTNKTGLAYYAKALIYEGADDSSNSLRKYLDLAQNDVLATYTGPALLTGSNIGVDATDHLVTTPDGKAGLTITAANSGLDGQIAGFSISISDAEGNVRKSVDTILNSWTVLNFARNESVEDNALKIHIGAAASQSISVGLADMRAHALGLKGNDGKVVDVSTQANANAAVAVFNNALQKALDQQTTIGAIEARLEYTASNLTVSSENVQAAESVIRDADMAKEMTNYTKNNVLLQAAQSMLAQANQNSSAVLSLLQ